MALGTVWGLHFRLLFFYNSLKCLDIKWWRRRESNPRPEILPSSFYMLSSSLSYRPAEFPGTGFLQHYPAKKFVSALAGTSQKLPR